MANRFVTGAPHKIKVTICHTAGLYGAENDDWNSAVFRSRRNRCSDGAERTDGGRALVSVQEIDILLSWLLMAVKPACCLAADSGITVAAACKSASLQPAKLRP